MIKPLLFFRKYIFINRIINRPLAAVIVKALKPTPLTPNQVTFISFLIGVAGAVFFALGKPVYFIWGGVLVQLSSVMDCVDGMLARARGISSEYGAYLDVFLDRINEFFIVTGFTLGLYAYSESLILLILGFIGLSLYFMQIMLYYLIKRMIGDRSNGNSDEARALLLFLICVFGLINRLDLGFYFFLTSAFYSNIYLVGYFISLGKKQNVSSKS